MEWTMLEVLNLILVLVQGENKKSLLMGIVAATITNTTTSTTSTTIIMISRNSCGSTSPRRTQVHDKHPWLTLVLLFSRFKEGPGISLPVKTALTAPASVCPSPSRATSLCPANIEPTLPNLQFCNWAKDLGLFHPLSGLGICYTLEFGCT